MATFFRDFEAKLACVAFVLTFTMVTTNVLLRYLFGQSLLFSEEISYLGFAHTVFLGAAYLYRQRVMIAVDFVVDAMSPRLKWITTLLSLVVLQITLLYLIYVSILLVSDGWVRRTAYLEMPYAYIHSASTIGFTLMAVYTAVFLRQVSSGQDLHYAEAAEQK
jgi:TRAP-type transport system small permease protein